MKRQWTVEEAHSWYEQQPWLVGCNFTPSTAINQLEMWQADSFDPVTIDRELGWAAGLGMNTVRTYLHDLLWDDPAGFAGRIREFLTIAASHRIKPILVIFDDCWNPEPALGPQPEARPGIHNSGWVQSPGLTVVNGDPAEWGRLQTYVTELLTEFAQDDRILMWDLYNEPGNNKNGRRSLPLLKAVFDWARTADVSQPLTAGVWFDDAQMNEFQTSASDIVTFHDYESADHLANQISTLRAHGRPLVCTEWMCRTRDSNVVTHLPVFKEEHVGCVNWGLVAGKTNTIYGWDQPHGQGEPDPWFHDLLRPDGTPYRAEEVEAFRRLTRARVH
ncbi:MAG: 1,4-beta-xylanase [Spirochaetales bacterium]|nr:MAG: 1,4-beta-xylanase [Spirochaetales bacterium]